jgi:hypothetical protein
MSSTGTLSWRPIEAKDVPACAVLLAAIEEVDQAEDVFGEEDLLETFRDPGRDYPRGSTCVHDGTFHVPSRGTDRGPAAVQRGCDHRHLLRALDALAARRNLAPERIAPDKLVEPQWR